VLVFSLGLTVYLFTNAHSRHVQVTEYAQKTLAGLQSRWDALRSDDHLLGLLCSDTVRDLPQRDRLLLRLFLESVLEEMAMIVHYIRRGYFRHTFEFARVYQGMIASLFRYPYFSTIWKAESTEWGPGRVRDAFGIDLIMLIDTLLEIESDHRPWSAPSDE
jgi:hypothetical protein